MKILLQNKNIVLTNNSLISIDNDNIAENGSLVRITQPKLTIIKDITRATIACPLGNSALSANEELTIREGILQKCLTALTTEVSEPTVFE